MSQENQIIEVEPGKWFYILEEPGAPKDSWDWREDAAAFGSFNSQMAAEDHLYDSLADVSGGHIVEHAEFRSNKTIAKLIATATPVDPDYVSSRAVADARYEAKF